MSQEVIDFIRLSRSSGVGSATFQKILYRFGSVQNALKALEADSTLMGRKITLCSVQNAEEEYKAGQKAGAVCITKNNAAYPSLLLEADDSPPFFWLKGNVNILNKVGCAIVGSRNASVGGRKIASSCAQNLSKEGYIVISGLARGIDAAAHLGSYKTGTIAVLAGGVDDIYPPEHNDLYHKILDHGGAILSENPCGSKPKANLFPRRNRVISGLSSAVLIVEAGLKSGSLTTAEFALAQNREVFAVPGSPLDARAAGPNKLLRGGASWAESSQDILNYLKEYDFYQDKASLAVKNKKIKEKLVRDVRETVRPDSAEEQCEENPSKQNHSSELLDYFGNVPISSDELIRISGQSPQIIVSKIAEYELLGDIERLPGNMFLKIPKKLA